MPVTGDLYGIEERLKEIDPDLYATYDGAGHWTVWHRGRQGRPYQVLSVGAGCGNRWPKDDPNAPEVDRFDHRVLYLVRAADLDAKGGADRAVRDMELREFVAKEASKARFGQKVEDVARDVHPFVARELSGMPDMRITFPAAKAAGGWY